MKIRKKKKKKHLCRRSYSLILSGLLPMQYSKKTVFNYFLISTFSLICSVPFWWLITSILQNLPKEKLGSDVVLSKTAAI